MHWQIDEYAADTSVSPAVVPTSPGFIDGLYAVGGFPSTVAMLVSLDGNIVMSHHSPSLDKTHPAL